MTSDDAKGFLVRKHKGTLLWEGEGRAGGSVGGEKVPAGKYALSVRKTEGDGWELTLHEGRGFSRPQGDTVLALETRLDNKSVLYEHMNIDVQPAGDKAHTRLNLEVRFDTMWATALIEIPK